ncbi:hypothetical protein [Anabaena sp. UHCC 0399]|uniref:hypothetical protein n=1 Tax=Anabaena sp. UHCC 0399 TaxID=3110238 RepID=UPI002B1EF5CA|nr:hypothetical protein [Anabaena sp. UHCC 0399]MEA5567818.1 hypothetical protein [Anabaena sp. UHCC 0399]
MKSFYYITESPVLPKSPFTTNSISIPVEPMRIWLIHSKSAVRNITAIQIWRVRRNTKIWIGAIA